MAESRQAVKWLRSFLRRRRDHRELMARITKGREGLSRVPIGGYPAVRAMRHAVRHADTPLQRAFAWCPWCDLEMISAGCRWWYNTRENLIYLQCSRCKRRSRWDNQSSPILECLDGPPARGGRAVKGPCERCGGEGVIRFDPAFPSGGHCQGGGDGVIPQPTPPEDWSEIPCPRCGGERGAT